MEEKYNILDKKILIVDDIEDNRDLILLLLEDFGYTNLLTAEDGEEAISILKDNPDTDLVLLDIFLPKMNGYEVLEAVKEDPEMEDIPIIMISAHDKLDSVIRCIESGALDYITKPVEETFLLARVMRFLEPLIPWRKNTNWRKSKLSEMPICWWAVSLRRRKTTPFAAWNLPWKHWNIWKILISKAS